MVTRIERKTFGDYTFCRNWGANPAARRKAKFHVAVVKSQHTQPLSNRPHPDDSKIACSWLTVLSFKFTPLTHAAVIDGGAGAPQLSELSCSNHLVTVAIGLSSFPCFQVFFAVTKILLIASLSRQPLIKLLKRGVSQLHSFQKIPKRSNWKGKVSGRKTTLS